jgi:succinate dehydrogenase/fumarate reductase flavoprotein subunit
MWIHKVQKRDHRTIAILAGLSLLSSFTLSPVRAQQGIAPGTVKASRFRDMAQRKWRKRWIASWAAVVAANAVDLHSSFGYREGNPWLRSSSGHLSTERTILIKSALGAGAFAAQWVAIRRRPGANACKSFALVNFAASGTLAGIAARNYALRSARVHQIPAASTPRE